MLSKLARLPRASSTTTTAVRAALSTKSDAPRKSLVTTEEGVHQTMQVSKSWRNKPLFRRQGDVRFKTGMEAANLLVREAKRRDSHEIEYIENLNSILNTLSPVFDRNPKYAFVAKAIMEPERLIQFRVSWIDDGGVNRMNRGFRVQYNSALGPYKGPLHFGAHINTGVMKAFGFSSVFANAASGFPQGAAVGGSDFNPLDKSEAEIQRFCQSYMTELAKYVGPDQDAPLMGLGVGQQEMGYMYGQYKRINTRVGDLRLSGAFDKAAGYGIAHFAEQMLKNNGGSLKGKKVMIVGSGKVARSVAEKLLEYEALPISFSDASGHVYEPDGVTSNQLATINAIKQERGALLGRYIISSTTAEFNKTESIFDIPCDVCIPCGAMKEIDDDVANKLADNGCKVVVEGGQGIVTPSARKILKKRGVSYGPHTMTMMGSTIAHELGPKATDEELEAECARIYLECKSTASEFNQRGDLYAGANIAGFIRVANAMMQHGAV